MCEDFPLLLLLFIIYENGGFSWQLQLFDNYGWLATRLGKFHLLHEGKCSETRCGMRGVLSPTLFLL